MEIHSKIVGVTYYTRQQNIKHCIAMVSDVYPPLFWRHEQNNVQDSNAVLVFVDKEMSMELGHLNRKLARKFVERLKAGVEQKIFLVKVTGGKDNKFFGLNISVVFES